MSYEDATAEIEPLCREWFRAAQENDDAWFEANLAEEFRYLMSGGEDEPKDRVIAMSHLIKNKDYAFLGATARRYGPVCVAMGRYTARSDLPPDLASSAQVEKYARGVELRFSCVWAPGDDGVLRCVLMQATSISDA